MSSGTEGKSSARKRAAQIRAKQLRAERRRRLLFAGGAVVGVLALFGVLVIVKLTAAGSPSAGATSEPIDRQVAAYVESVPRATLDKVGVGTAQGGPKSISAPELTEAGKPKVLYVGAEYCPYCAAERWPVVVALSRFGSFSGLGSTYSAANDAFPHTPTLSFHGASYRSKYLAFTGVETTSNEIHNGNYDPLDSLTHADEKTFATYDSPPYVNGAGGSIPFIDIAGRYVSSGATYSPQLLAGETHLEIAEALRDPSSPIAMAIDGSANLFTAAVCQATGNLPANVCTAPGVTAAAAQLGQG